jgi:outer membrane protein TolC
MLNISSKHFIFGFLSVLIFSQAQGQKLLTIKDAEQIALSNYGTIKAKANQLNASKAYLTETKTEQLPDVNISAQQDYGTVNGQNGPLYGYRGLAIASSGPALLNQNWNAAFGSLYLTNVSWDFFSFGKAKGKVQVQRSTVRRDETDLVQEQFEHEIRVASTYLNLLAAQQLSKAAEDNLKRAVELQKVVIARVKNGLNAGVDSSQANAEVSSATIALTNSRQTVADQSNQLATYLGIPHQEFLLDSAFVTRSPVNTDPQPTISTENHPVLQYYQNRVNVSNDLAKYYSTFSYPTLSFFGIYQGRGSGFKGDYASNLSDYNSSYGSGADPTRYNYLVGIGLVWNLTSPFRVHYQVKSQKYTSAQYKDEYDLVSEQLRNQQILAETRISNALKNYNEVPLEIKAASDAYQQKYALYQNGLANIVDFTQALYLLNRAEVDKDITQNNVWQAILFKAAATGDFGIFINNF